MQICNNNFNLKNITLIIAKPLHLINKKGTTPKRVGKFLIEKVRGLVERACLFTYFFNQHKIQKITKAMRFYTHAYASWEDLLSISTVSSVGFILSVQTSQNQHQKESKFSKRNSLTIQDLHNSNRGWQHEDF